MNDFTKGVIAKQIILFSIPMLIGNIFQQMYNIVDAVVVGRFLGSAALAAVGVSMNALFFFIAALQGLTTGASVVLSQFFGAKQYDNLKTAMSTSIIFLGGLSVVMTVLGMVFTPHMLRLLNAPEYIFDYAVIYMRVQMAGLVFMIFFNMYTSYLRAMGNSRTPLYILMFTTTFNGLLNMLFVVVLGFGIFAVSLGTIITQGLAAVICFVYTYKKVPLLRVNRLVFDKKLFIAILKYGLPAALQLSIVSLASLTISRLINSFGTAAIAGITAANRIDNLAMLPISTLSLALSTFVGQNMGAKLEERAVKGLKTMMATMVGGALLISAVLIFTAPYLVQIFIDMSDVHAAEMLATGQNYLRIMVVFYFLFAFLFAFNGFYRGAGDAVIAMVFPIVSLTIRTGSAYALVYFAGMGPEALAWSIPIGWGIASSASFIYYKKRLWVGKMVTK